MNQAQFSKFSPITVAVKKNVRQLRLNAGYSMNEGARLLGVSRKQLEDIETIRNNAHIKGGHFKNIATDLSQC